MQVDSDQNRNSVDPGLDRIFQGCPVDENIDQLADDFEKNWTEESVDLLEAILASVENKEERRALLDEFLTMEFELRFKNGLRVEPDNYRKRFPRFEKQVDEIYRRLMDSRRFGNYEYFEILGKGGLGIVYRARHVLLDRIGAVKVLRGDLAGDTDFVNRFLREIRMISRLTHENIVNAEYAGCDQARYYLVMEYVEGRDLARIVKKQGPLALETACEILRQVALGLQHASAQGIIHRDIKPGNIMLSVDGIVKILDFGLGKFHNSLEHPDLEHSLTTAGSAMGSVDYIAPEQWEDAVSVTVKADIYSLGCTLFYLLTGKTPFRRENMTGNQKMIAHIKGEIPSLKDYRNDVPDELEKCYRRMIAKDPADRFETPVEVAKSLERFAGPTNYEILLEICRERESEKTSIFSNENKNSTKNGNRHTAPERSRFLRFVGAVLVLFIFGAVLFSSVLLSTVFQINRVFTETEPKLPTIETASKFTDSTPETTKDFVQFTGDSGKWWFEEVPWLLPVVRKTIAATASTDEIVLCRYDGNLLWKLAEDTALSQMDPLKSLLWNLSTGAPVSQWKPLAETYLEMQGELPELWHTQAVLLHAGVADQSDPSAADRAKALYWKAILGYRKRPDEISRLLENLCRFDLGWLEFLLNEDVDEFQRELLAIESVDDSSNFRQALSLVSAERQMEIGRHRDQAFESMLTASVEHERKSSRLSWLHRRYAAALSRQWRLTEARPQWKKALESLTEADSRSFFRNFDDERPDRADFYCHCRLAEALSDRHTGNLTEARRQYRDLIEELRETLTNMVSEEIDRNPLRQAVLKKNLSRALEHLADCTLFTPIYFGAKPPRSAGYFIEEAGELYKEAKFLAQDENEQFVLQCKQGLLAFCDGDCQRVESCWTEAKRIYGELPEPSKISRTESYYAMSKAIFSAFETNEIRVPNDGESAEAFRPEAKELRGLLDLFRLNSNAFDRYEGEKLDVHLFCIRQLLERSDNEEQRHQLTRSDIERYLDPILLQHLQSECAMMPFLHDYFDLVVRLQDGEDIVKTAEYIRASRCQRRSGTVQNAHLIFYFSPAGGNGFALFLPLEMQNPRRIELDVTREMIIQSAKSGSALQLPRELVDLVEETLKSNRKLVLSWDDSPCWRRDSDSLTLNEWPFDEQLDRNRIFGIVK